MAEIEEEGPATAGDGAKFTVVDQPRDADACLVVDVSNLAYRSLHAYSDLTSKSRGDAPSGHVYGAVRLLLSTLANEVDPGRWCPVLCYDGDGAREARQQVLPSYKADREHRFNPCPDVRQTLSHFPGLHVVQAEREGDDAVAWITERIARAGQKVVILTGDKDMWALKRYPQVQVFSPNMKRYVVPQDWVDRYHVEDPSKIPLAKAITGDSSDNILGVKGIRKALVGRVIGAPDVRDVQEFYTAVFADTGGAPARVFSRDTAAKILEASERLRANEKVILPWLSGFGPGSVTRVLKSPETAAAMAAEVLSWDCVELAGMLPAIYGGAE